MAHGIGGLTAVGVNSYLVRLWKVKQKRVALNHHMVYRTRAREYTVKFQKWRTCFSYFSPVRKIGKKATLFGFNSLFDIT